MSRSPVEMGMQLKSKYPLIDPLKVLYRHERDKNDPFITKGGNVASRPLKDLNYYVVIDRKDNVTHYFRVD